MSVPGISLGSGHLAGDYRFLSPLQPNYFPRLCPAVQVQSCSLSFPAAKTTVFSGPLTTYSAGKCKSGSKCVCMGRGRPIGWVEGIIILLPFHCSRETWRAPAPFSLCGLSLPSHLDMPSRGLRGTVPSPCQSVLPVKQRSTGWSLSYLEKHGGLPLHIMGAQYMLVKQTLRYCSRRLG